MSNDLIMQFPAGNRVVVSMEHIEPTTTLNVSDISASNDTSHVLTGNQPSDVPVRCDTSSVSTVLDPASTGHIISNGVSTVEINRVGLLDNRNIDTMVEVDSPSKVIVMEETSDADTIDVPVNSVKKKNTDDSSSNKIRKKGGRKHRAKGEKPVTIMTREGKGNKKKRGRPTGSKNVKNTDKECDKDGGKTKKSSDETLFACEICDRYFSKMGQLKEHVIRRHKEERNHECMICNKTFKTRGDLNKHTLIHTGVKAFKCSVCSKAFTQSNGLKSHMAMHTGVRAYTCPMCHKAFTQSSHMTRHMKMHTDTGSFDCPTCGKSFKHQANLSTHMYNHKLLRVFKCDVCHQAFKRRGHLKKHQKTHKKGDQKRYPCVLCNKSFDLPTQLVSHMLKHKYNCDVCHKVFAKAIRLKEHLKQNHTLEEVRDAAIAVASSNLENKPHKNYMKVAKRCEICGITYTRLSSHMATHEVFKCTVCQKGFLKQELLDAHLRSHTDYQIREANAKSMDLIEQQNQHHQQLHQQLQQTQPQQVIHHIQTQPHTHSLLHPTALEPREDHSLPLDRQITSNNSLTHDRNMMNNQQMTAHHGQLIGGQIHMVSAPMSTTVPSQNNQMIIANGQMATHGEIISGHSQLMATGGHVMGTATQFIGGSSHIMGDNFHIMCGKPISGGKGQLM